ncbi:hypothetical protein F2Q68_00014882 [Brassica cretica]|uniref:Uncharacterized protein n=2 Tax=Brassica cretica TaxID=69181 RepID=A0A8S9HNY7_BRACR|nr:hypothetical protein F2Q68_00014882 [Brassica cretica]KAF3606839.1 hypothetical protein DY000_02047637 [Brassica cretica]
MEVCPILVTDPVMEADFDSSEKLEREKLGTNFYLQIQILVLESLHPVIDTPKVKPALLFMLRNEVGQGEYQIRFAKLWLDEFGC